MEKIRHYQRYTVSGSGFIYQISVQNVAFSINDISASGMNITTAVDLEESQIIAMEILISGNILPYARQLEGKVVRKSKYDSIYRYGVRFMSLPSKEIIEIDEYLRVNYSSVVPHRTSYDTGENEKTIGLSARHTGY